MTNDETMVMTPECTIVYPSLFEQTAFKDAEPSYSATFLIPKTEDIKTLRNACRIAAFKKWGQNVQIQQLRSPLRDGDQKAIDENGNVDRTNFYFGNIFLRAKSKYSIPIVNIYNEEITDSNEIYGGCVVRAYIQFFGYDFMGNKGVSAGLRAVQKVSDGDPIGAGRVNPLEIFKEFAKPKPDFLPPDMDSREWNETGQRGRSGGRIVGADQDPWGQPSREPGDEPDDIDF